MSVPTVVAIRCEVPPSTTLLHRTHILFTPHHQQQYPSYHASLNSDSHPVRSPAVHNIRGSAETADDW
jgi:hypothetical protein